MLRHSHDRGETPKALSSGLVASRERNTGATPNQNSVMQATAPTARQRIAAASDGMRAVGQHDPMRAERVAPVQAPQPIQRGAPRSHPYARAGVGPASNAAAREKAALRAQLMERVEKLREAQKREEQEEKRFEDDLNREDPACMGSTAAASTQEMGEMEKKFVETLQNGTKDRQSGRTKFKGIMRSHNMLSQQNLPYTHQRNVVRQIASRATTSFLVAHDPGLGKTATALMAYCAEACMLERVPKMLISVPSATLDQWQDAVADWVRVNPNRVMVTSKLAHVDYATLRNKDIVILSKDCVARAYATCFQHYQKHHQIQTGPGLRWVSQWDRIGIFEMAPGSMPPLHPILEPPTDEAKGWFGHWDLLVVDEVHACRSPDTRWCEAHAEVAHISTKRIGLTGTPLINKTGDLGGIAKALDAPRAPIDFQKKDVWCKDRNYKLVNRDTVRAFTEKHLFHRATDKILNLPPIIKEAINYDVQMPEEFISVYNGILGDARNLKLRIERAGGRATAQDLQRLMALLQHMQQYVVSPLLAQHGVAKFKSEQHLFLQASSNENATGAFFALRDELAKLRSEGHRRVVVAANHTAIMKIVRIWLERNHPEFGRIYVYDGELSQKERLNSKRGFLQTDNAVLFLSVGAGGVGLHLVPGCEAMIFWGSLSYSPAHVQQCLKRIHRIGQLCPITGSVAIKYLIPHGSVDGAIGRVHSDKDRLMRLCVDGDNSGFGGESDDEWRKHARIVDEAKPLGTDGNFPPMPDTQVGADGMIEAFTLLPGVKTRDVPELPLPTAEPPAKRNLTNAEEASAAAAAVIALDSDDE